MTRYGTRGNHDTASAIRHRPIVFGLIALWGILIIVAAEILDDDCIGRQILILAEALGRRTRRLQQHGPC
jgi:hypothetical protein